jgi:two-component system chemotaxis response regulator CheB
LVVIGASTGGPQTVAEILARLPATLPVPILYVQHITRGFTAGLVEWLKGQTKLKVKVADAGEALLPGTVYIGPEGLQLGLNGDLRARLAPPGGGDAFCPSVSHLLASVVDAVGGEAMGVLLTGMGRDGVTELHRLRERGGITIAQNEKSSVVYGMPGVAVREGAAEHVLAPAQIAQSIAALAGTTGERRE